MNIKLSAALTVALLLVVSTGCHALTFNFESGLGHNGQDIGSSVAGLVFSTIGSGGVRYADINTGYYSVTSDNGKVFEDGEYFVSGDVAAYVPNLTNKAKISFTYGTASWFTVGYSSQFDFALEAYNSSGALLTSSTGGPNTKSQGGTGLAYLTVNSPNISYVLLHDQGGYWVMDNISTDAPIPEPASLMILATGAVGVLLRRRYSRTRARSGSQS